MNSESKLKKFVCKNPFEYFDIQEKSSYICCPSWCSKDVFTKNGKLGWDGHSNIDVRKSVLDGSYKYCDKNICPSFNFKIIAKKNKIMIINSNITNIEEKRFFPA